MGEEKKGFFEIKASTSRINEIATVIHMACNGYFHKDEINNALFLSRARDFYRAARFNLIETDAWGLIGVACSLLTANHK